MHYSFLDFLDGLLPNEDWNFYGKWLQNSRISLRSSVIIEGKNPLWPFGLDRMYFVDFVSNLVY